MIQIIRKSKESLGKGFREFSCFYKRCKIDVKYEKVPLFEQDRDLKKSL